MSWARLDDGFADHPKILDLSDAAFRLHVCALCLSSRRSTDGFIATRDLRILAGMMLDTVDLSPLVQELTKARDPYAPLWEAKEGGWEIHDFLEYNPPAELVEKQKARARERMKRLRARQEELAEERSRERASERSGERDASRDGVRSRPRPVPSRPVPTPKEPNGSSGGSPKPPYAQDSAAQQAALEVLRDTWPEFKRRAFKALGIDDKAERVLEGAGGLLLPQPHHTDLVEKWKAQHAAGATAEDLLLLADWIGAGYFAGLRYDRPGCLARSLGQHLSDARIWHKAGRPDPNNRHRAPPAAGVRDDHDRKAEDEARRKATERLLREDP